MTAVTTQTGIEPTPYQRKKMLEALYAPHHRLPGNTYGRSLDAMHAERWIAVYTADGRPAAGAVAAGHQGGAHFRLTKQGRMALLTDAKRSALETVDERGALASTVPRPTLTALTNDGFVERYDDQGRRDPHGWPYITNLGRRLMGLPEVDETPAAEVLVAELAKRDITAEVDDSPHGDQVVYRSDPVEAVFYRTVSKESKDSASQPGWMHNPGWYASISDGGDRKEIWVVDGDDVRAGSAAIAMAFVEWLTQPPTVTAGAFLAAALAEESVHPVRDLLSYAIALTHGTPDGDVMNGPHIKVADGTPDVDHAPGEHTGWVAWLCDGDGAPVEQIYDGTADGSPVDCRADSAAAARAIANRITTA
ncbi:hypothetical protein ABZ599_32700 [Streptomyces misionensis]|uniref:hypothetical protein n=1 Tax=Streptomyces misionensis TaxID=67331 RepID=UPI00340EF1B3